MDPHAALAEMALAEIRRILAYHKHTQDDWNRLGELFEALDEWIMHGGSLPSDWQYWAR